MWRADGHRDCFGWLQQHLSLGTDDTLPGEIITDAWNWASEYTGDANTCTYVLVLLSLQKLSLLYYNFFLISFQVSVIQYGVDPRFEFKLNDYRTKKDVISAASGIQQKYGSLTNTFQAIQFARLVLLWTHSGKFLLITFVVVGDWTEICICLCLPSSVSGGSMRVMVADQVLQRCWWSSLMASLTTASFEMQSLQNAIKKASPASVLL